MGVKFPPKDVQPLCCPQLQAGVGTSIIALTARVSQCVLERAAVTFLANLRRPEQDTTYFCRVAVTYFLFATYVRISTPKYLVLEARGCSFGRANLQTITCVPVDPRRLMRTDPFPCDTPRHEKPLS